jgi:hypothetical protein
VRTWPVGPQQACIRLLIDDPDRLGQHRPAASTIPASGAALTADVGGCADRNRTVFSRCTLTFLVLVAATRFCFACCSLFPSLRALQITHFVYSGSI